MSRLAVAGVLTVASAVACGLAVAGALYMRWWTAPAAGAAVLLAGVVLWLTRR